jgi:hypothetical protein
MKRSVLAYYIAFCFLVQEHIFAQQGPTVPGTTPADAPQVQQEIHQIESRIAKLPDRGAALFLLAHDYAHLGKLESALSLLKECTSLDESIDPEGDAEFRRLGQNSEFRKLIERVHRRYPAGRRAHIAFTVPEKDIIPEGLALDPATGALYMGSLHLGKIVKITKTQHLGFRRGRKL